MIRLLKDNGSFLSKLILVLVIQALITFAIMEYGRSKNITLDILPLIMLIILTIILLLVIMLTTLPIYAKFIIFTFLSISIGFTMSSDMVRSKVSDDSINRAIWGAIGIFITMFITGLCLTSRIRFFNIWNCVISSTICFFYWSTHIIFLSNIRRGHKSMDLYWTGFI